MLRKRVLILQQSNSRFAAKGKELCGMVKLLADGEHIDLSVFVTNADVNAPGEWWLLLSLDGQCKAFLLGSLSGAQFSTEAPSMGNVGCLLVKKEIACYEAARAFVGNAELCNYLHSHMATLATFSPPQQSSATDYESFIQSTDDFYQGKEVEKLRKSADSRYKSVQEYSAAFEKYYATDRQSNYYNSVRRQICKVFLQFPPYYPLINKYPSSFFVKIDFPSSSKYFVLGVLQKDNQIKYICYGLPAEKEGVQDKDFVFVRNNPVGFYMLFQDATTGQITVADGMV